jgi:hypothetical protein
MRVKLDIALRSSDSLTPQELDEIWAVTDRYVETSRDYFEAKLRALPEVGLWRTETGALIGLVSLDVYRVRWEGRTSIILFTSSVVIDDRFRGRDLVLRTGMKLLVREKLRRPWARAYWLFDTFSYKSYMILPRNLTEFWPRRNHATPGAVERFIDFLAQHRYGADWSRETGVVRRSGKKRLRPDTAPVTPHQLTNEDIRFFESKNPGHRDGDMLVCLVPLNARNLRGLVARKVRALRSRPAPPAVGSKGDRRSTEIPAVLPPSRSDVATRR